MKRRERAVSLDKLLNKFDGQHNFTRTWEECKNFTDINSAYGNIENMLMQLLSDGKLKGIPDDVIMPPKIKITQAGWAAMTDYKNTGYFAVYKIERRKERLNKIIVGTTIITLILVAIQTYQASHQIPQQSTLSPIQATQKSATNIKDTEKASIDTNKKTTLPHSK